MSCKPLFKLDRRRFMTHSLLAASAAVLPVSPIMAEKVDRPNILWILVEDIGLQLGCYGNKSVHTPNLDRLELHDRNVPDLHRRPQPSHASGP